jgi:hypothetical protein
MHEDVINQRINISCSSTQALNLLIYILYYTTQSLSVGCCMMLNRDKWVLVTTAWRVLRLRMEQGPPMYKVAANVLNEQSRTDDKGWSSSSGVGRGANNSLP